MAHLEMDDHLQRTTTQIAALNFERDHGPTRALTLFLAGPACSGKTSLVRSLPGDWSRYEERFRGNPQALPMIAGREFDAVRLQQWFLDQMSQWLKDQEPIQGLLVEQHYRIGVLTTVVQR